MPYTPIDGTEEITELPVVKYIFGNSENWTLEEQEIGTYLGKPLYRRGFQTTSPPNSTTKAVIVLDTKIVDAVTTIKAYFQTNGASFEVGYENNTSQTSGIWYKKTTGELLMTVSGTATSWLNIPITVFVDYTKKAD